MTSTVMAQLKTHPEKVIPMLLYDQESLAYSFVPQGALWAIGGTWVGGNLLLFYALQAYLSNLQVKAGQVGVMEAIQSLEADVNTLPSTDLPTQSPARRRLNPLNG